MIGSDIDKLEHIVKQFAQLNDAIKAAQAEQKELATAAYDAGLIRVAGAGDARKVVKRLAKELDWDAIKREAQRQLEESLDECRAALGLLADLPLGQAQMGSVGARTDHANGNSNGEAKRSRGRPKGAKNKPKVVGGTDSQAPLDPSPVPDVPDVPDVAAA